MKKPVSIALIMVISCFLGIGLEKIIHWNDIALVKSLDGSQINKLSEKESNIPKVVISDRDLISKGAAPGAIQITDSERWNFQDEDGQDIFLTSRIYKKGRVIAVGHDGFLIDNLDAANKKAFLKENFKWLSRLSRNSLILFSSGHCEWVPTKYRQKSKHLFDLLQEWNYKVKKIPGVIDDTKLKNARVLVVGNAWGNMTDSEVESILRFVSNGGGLLVAGLGWSWQAYSSQDGYRCEGKTQEQNVNDLSTYPMNHLVKPYGMMWTEKIIDEW